MGRKAEPEEEMQPVEDVLIQHSQESSKSAMPRKGAHPNSTGGPTYCPPLWRLRQRGVTASANSVLVTNAMPVPSPFTSLARSRLTYCRKSFFIMLWSVRCSAGS